MRTPTAAVIVVGAEVLSGKVQDANGPYAARRLRERGIDLRAVLTLPDELAPLAEAIARERARVDWLLTAGGIGPTHDDVTLAAVARALDRPLVRHPVLAENIHRWHARRGDPAGEAALRMADVPEGTRLVGDPAHPILAVENVAVLPGVPSFFRAQLDRFTEGLGGPAFRLASVVVSLAEDLFADHLARLARAYPDVAMGSYPRFDLPSYEVKITFEGTDGARVVEALRAFEAELPGGAVLRRQEP